MSYKIDENGTAVIDSGDTIDRNTFGDSWEREEEAGKVICAVISDGATAINAKAFYDCWKLEEVILPDTVTHIGTKAFKDRRRLKHVRVRKSTKKPGRHYVDKRVSYKAFYDCCSLETIELPDGIVGISKQAFSGCRSLTHIVLPASLESIGIQAFSGCSSLTDIALPASLELIREQAFENCSRLKNISIPEENEYFAVYGGILYDKNLQNIVFFPPWMKEVSLLDSLDIDENAEELSGTEWQKLTFQGVTIHKDTYDSISLFRVADFIRKKDFSIKIPNFIKFSLALSMFAENPENEEICTYIAGNFSKIEDYLFDLEDTDTLLELTTSGKFVTGRNVSKLMLGCIDNECIPVISQLLENGKLVTKCNIDKFIQHAIDNQKHEIYLILLNHKNDHIGYQDVTKKLKL